MREVRSGVGKELCMLITLDPSLTLRRTVDDGNPQFNPGHDPGEWTAEMAATRRRSGLVERISGPSKYDRAAMAHIPKSVVFSDVPVGAEAYHKNYMEYLEVCYARHYIPVVAPHLLWYGVLAEIATAIKADPELYRDLFTRESDAATVLVPSADDSLDVLVLLGYLRHLVPTDMSMFMPEFSTATTGYTVAASAAFADAVSPYYNYMVYACGFPSIRVDGTSMDWTRFAMSAARLAVVLPGLATYLNRVSIRAEDIGRSLDLTTTHEELMALWKGFFKNERCGSGSQTVVSGWYTDFYMTVPGLAKSENFTSQVSRVEYTSLSTQRRYALYAGLFASTFEDGVLVPDFSTSTEFVGVVEQPRDVPTHGEQPRLG